MFLFIYLSSLHVVSTTLTVKRILWTMMTSSNGNIFRVTDHLCGEFHAQRPVTRSFGVFFDLRLNKRLSKQSWGWWFETLSRPLWRHRNVWWPFSRSYRETVKSLGPRQNGRYFPADVSKSIFLIDNVWISIKISLKFVPNDPIYKIPALVQIMACRPCDKL